MIDHATNGDGDSGRFKMLADWEHDDPEQTPSIVYHSSGPSLAVVMAELRISNPYAHGIAKQHMRFCACCDEWKLAGAMKCAECSAPWERA
jgi:hypothetical protein